MSAPLDLLTEALSNAPLTPEQRETWRDLCAELVLARVRIQELENKVRVLELQEDGIAAPHPPLNRSDFNREVARMLAFDERYGGLSSVLYMNIENLAAIRERHSSALVDAAIRCIADTLAGQIRRSDILGRLAYDEFGILLPRCDNASAWKKGEHIAAILYDTLTQLWGPGLKPQINYGAYTFREKEDLATGLKQVAKDLTQLERL